MSDPITLTGVLRAVARRLADDWLAPACALCAAPPASFARATRGLCRACARLLPLARAPRCACCATPLGQRVVPARAQQVAPPQSPGHEAQRHAAALCPACADDPPSFDDTLALAAYAPPVDRWITALKFGRDPGLARPLGEMLAARLLASELPRPELVLPVPLGTRRLAARGFNQALEIARPVARALGRPPALGVLARRRETDPQSALARAERERNLRDAFSCGPAVAGRCVAVVDDVMTTGATLAAVALALRRAGAIRVINLVACRA